MVERNSIDSIKKQGLDAFLNYASIGIILVDKKMDILISNTYANKLFGFEKFELEGKSLDLLIPSRYKQKHLDYQYEYYKNPQSRPMGLGMELFAVRKNGSEFPVEVSLGTYKMEEEVFVIAFVVDVTSRVNSERSIRKLNAELEQKVSDRTEALANAIVQLEKQIKETEEARKELAISLAKERELGELKSRFVSMASHEFRTPLSTILSSTYLLQQYTSMDDQPKRDKHIERILSSVSTLNTILEDFLSVGKIEEDKVNLNLDEIDIKLLIESTLNQFVNILKKGQKINYIHQGERVVNTDPALVKNILMNLISNAVKFSDPGKTILIGTTFKEPGWTLSVKDEGIGIPEKDQKNLFERFYRASNVSAIKGTGLGLHIVSRYISLLKGNITCFSQEHHGTEFVINFPYY
ncbi:MAG: PAS domain-containing sensor histidine kinase [Saprospiraceae bacterium]